ncbi:3-hydroxyacyl-CoA dehydrogenase family protein [Syntrophus aciditrophicus]|uniref:3-hydroxyacyl-CoA dehydrogenase n=1 Tax=Syntrophus aciditrophicus (strain SB) TaxID=56780 RepID=Q2LUN4_SYNAS|nr:3-hydroxyacyl-CoA dehydrogenase family protein [Syntrophus aciditrophicus]ABC77793.1 3-hydroxyacyl-CoA dehydrogenase [Syntrophus aciditrophicus SB]OPY18808.1 MAG: putative 3-hydroxybutyryl-CoA dehydrogenase [Syntrophus sp. PtaB.Bin075]
MQVKKLGVLGAGAMGAGIAHLAAQRGIEVVLCDIDMKFVDGGVARMEKLMAGSIKKGKMTEDEAKAVLGRIKKTVQMEDFADCDFIVEAIIENLKIKQDAFSKLDTITRPEVILASNTSSMSLTEIAAATKRPEKVVGMHFFNPPQVMKLVEIIRGYYTSDETFKATEEFSKQLGKITVEIKKDAPGFVVNRVMMASAMEAMKLYEEGVASMEDIDQAVKLGLNAPMGPFELMDFVGIDINKSILDYLADETMDVRWNPPLSIKLLLKSGRLGRKNGAGWYKY